MFRTLIIRLAAFSIMVVSAGCGSGSSVAHRDPIYADLGAGTTVLGTPAVGTPVEFGTIISAIDGPLTFRFTAPFNARIRTTVVAGPGARDIKADLWNAMGWGFIAPIDEWLPDWSVIYEAPFSPGDYDIVVAPTDSTAGAITVRAEILEVLPVSP